MTWTEVQRKSKKSKTTTSVSSEPPSSSEGSRSSSPNWSPCSSPPCPQLDQVRPPGPTHSTPKPMRPPPGLSEPSGTELKYLPGCLNTVHLNFVRVPNAYAKSEKDWYNDAWRKDNDWRDQEEYMARYGVPLNSYTGDRINIPDDIPLRADPIPISHQLETLQPVLRKLQDMKKQSKESKRKQLLNIFDQEMELVNSKDDLLSDLARLSMEYRILEVKPSVTSSSTSESIADRTRSHPGVEICESILSDESRDELTNQRQDRPIFCYNPNPPMFQPSMRSPQPSRPVSSSVLSSPMPKLNANAIVFKPIMGSSPTMAEVQKVLIPNNKFMLANPKMPYRRQLRGIRGRPIQLGLFR